MAQYSVGEIVLVKSSENRADGWVEAEVLALESWCKTSSDYGSRQCYAFRVQVFSVDNRIYVVERDRMKKLPPKDQIISWRELDIVLNNAGIIRKVYFPHEQ